MAAWEVAPVLRVRDVRKAAAYYRERLGFDCPDDSILAGAGDEGAIYAIARRDGAQIHLGRARSGQRIDPGQRPNSIGAYVYVTGVRALYEELVRRGADIVQVPTVMPYGLEDVVVRDLDGYHIAFGAPAD